MTSRRRTKEILDSFTSMAVYAQADPWVTGEAGQRFVAVDLLCRDCDRRLTRAKMSTSKPMAEAEPTWHKGTVDTYDVPDVGLVAVLVCVSCSKETGSVQRHPVLLADLEEQLREIWQPDARVVVERRV